MANWNQFLTNIYNLILQKHHSQQSTAFYVPFEDTLSKSLAFDEIAKQLFNKEIIGNGTAMYTDFGDNDITDKYKLSFTDKFFKPILLSVNGAIPGFGTAGISFKYDSTDIEKKIISDSENCRLIFLIQHWDSLNKDLKLFFTRLINNLSAYEKKYNKKIIILVGSKNLINNDVHFSKSFGLHHFELDDLKNVLNEIIETSYISDDLVEILYPLTKGNLEKIYNLISLSPKNSDIEQLLDELLNKIDYDFRQKQINPDFIYMLSVLPEYFNPYEAEEYFNLKTFQIEKAIDILTKLLVLTSVKNRKNFYSLILILRDRLLHSVEKGQKEVYQKYYHYLCKNDPHNYKLKIKILSKFETNQEYLLSLYLLWHEQTVSQDYVLDSETEDLSKLKFLDAVTKEKYIQCIEYDYSKSSNSLYEQILPDNSLLSSILLKNDINFQGNTSQDFSFASLCETLYTNIVAESEKDIIIEPIHYLSCIYMLLPHLIDKLNEIDKFKKLNEDILNKFYITKDIEQRAKYLKNIYLRKSFLYKTNDNSINDANKALKFFSDIDDEIEQYYTLGSLLGLYIISSEYEKAKEVTNELKALSEDSDLPLYWKSENNFIVLDFLSYPRDDFEYWKNRFEKILKQYEVNDVSKHLIYTNLCSISLYYSHIEDYKTYKNRLEELMEVDDLSDIEDASIDDFYRYFFGWFEFCRLLLESQQQAKIKYDQLKDFYPVIFESEKRMLFEKHRRYKKIFDSDIKTGKEFSEFLITSKFSAREWNHYRRGLMVTDIQYTSAL